HTQGCDFLRRCPDHARRASWDGFGAAGCVLNDDRPGRALGALAPLVDQTDQTDQTAGSIGATAIDAFGIDVTRVRGT
ncbi:MAG: hypothetical protein HKP61_17300, partial [Dactylosporangium sp.]|nr:hypothetical protein [Dactylosporangium sp.]NNJ62663.1 hypothetical protein [Dactylosporangium sp.]